MIHTKVSLGKYRTNIPAEVEERRRPTPTTTNPGKRKAVSPPDENDDGLQRAVKKLIRQAQLEANSPTNSMSLGNSHSGHGTPAAPDGEGERPVFDAYPMPQQGQVAPVPAITNTGSEQVSSSTTTRPTAQGTVAVPPPRSTNSSSTNKASDLTFDPNQLSNTFNTQQPQPQTQSQNQSTTNQNFLFPPEQFDQTQFQNPPNGNGNGNANANGNGFNYNPSPSFYPFPTDPSLDFPNIFPNQGAPLDPAVESMLASYFPSNSGNEMNGQQIGGGGGNIPGSVGPEDFLSRVFSFGWNDPAPSGPGPEAGTGGNGGTGGGGEGGQGIGGDPSAGGGGGFGFGGEGWGSGGGWMA
jgi:hypothetical protein